MCTQTDTRDINELLALETYQDMSDIEIELVIEYRATQKMIERITSVEHQNQIENLNAIIALHNESCQRTNDLVLYMIDNMTLYFETVEPKTFTPRSLEV